MTISGGLPLTVLFVNRPGGGAFFVPSMWNAEAIPQGIPLNTQINLNFDNSEPDTLDHYLISLVYSGSETVARLSTWGIASLDPSPSSNGTSTDLNSILLPHTAASRLSTRQ